MITEVAPEPAFIGVAESVEATVTRLKGAGKIRLGFASIGKPLAGTTQATVMVVSFFPLDVDIKEVKDHLTSGGAFDSQFEPKRSVLVGDDGRAGPVGATTS